MGDLNALLTSSTVNAAMFVDARLRILLLLLDSTRGEARTVC